MGRTPETVTKHSQFRYLTKTVEVELFTWEKLDFTIKTKLLDCKLVESLVDIKKLLLMSSFLYR
jgi:hypothetical protein